MSTFHQTLAAKALEITLLAVDEASYHLPPKLLQAFKIATNHAADPWDSVKHSYATSADRDPEVMAILVDLVELSHAAAKLKNVVEGKPLPPVESLNLQLARTRRAS